MHHFFQERITIRRILAGVLFVAFLAIAIFFQHRHLNAIRPSRPYRDSLYLPRGEYVKIISLGYDMAMSDFIWLRSIQAFGGHFLGDREYTSFINLFDVITDLNPYFIDAYLFGNTVIGEEFGNHTMGLELLDKGILKAIRRSYRIGYWGGYDCIWNVKDYTRAKYFYRMALKTPDVPDYITRLITYADEKMGNYRIAYEKRMEDYLRAADSGDDLIKDISLRKIRVVVKEWHLRILMDAAKQYKEEFGKDITGLQQLVGAGHLASYEAPDVEAFLKGVDELNMKQEKLFPHFQELVGKSIKTFTNRIPPDPYGLWYFLPKGQTSDDETFILSGFDGLERTKFFLKATRFQLKKYKEEHGSYPLTLQILFSEEKEEIVDIFGEPWIYNPVTGEIRSRTFKDL